jgi:hypothetical protein
MFIHAEIGLVLAYKRYILYRPSNHNWTQDEVIYHI